LVRIEDATGTGNAAKVDSKNRVHVKSVNTTEPQEQTKQGNSFDIDSALINLTSALASAVLFIKNNEDVDLVLETLFFNFGPSTGGSGIILIELLRNANQGTIVTAGDAITPRNRNFGSSSTLEADVEGGAEAKTLTNGERFFDVFEFDSKQFPIPVDISIPKGSSIGIRITPPTGNTSIDVIAGARVFKDTLLEKTV